MWDLASGAPGRESVIRYHGSMWAVAVGDLGGWPVAVSGHDDGTVYVWEPARGPVYLASKNPPVREPLIGHGGPVRTVGIGELDGRPIAVSGGDDGTLRIWELAFRGPPPGLPGTGPRATHRPRAGAGSGGRRA